MKLVPKFPETGNPKDEALYFAYQQARISYLFLCNLLESDSLPIGIYIYAWSVIDNSSRMNNLLSRKNETLRKIRNAFQHVDEKIDLYRNGSIPVFGALTWWYKNNEQQPKFGVFPQYLSRTFAVPVLNNIDSYNQGISHLTLSALSTNGPKDTGAKQQVLRLDKLVLDMGNEICSKFGYAQKEKPAGQA